MIFIFPEAIPGDAANPVKTISPLISFCSECSTQLSKWEVEYCVEKMKRLIDDGFQFEDIVEWFSVTLNDFIAINEANKE